jgi:hypothetical protein
MKKQPTMVYGCKVLEGRRPVKATGVMAPKPLPYASRPYPMVMPIFIWS